MLKTTFYRQEKSCAYSPAGLHALYGLSTDTIEPLLSIAGTKKILPSGSIMCADNTILKRGKLMVDAAIGATELYVPNPWVFKVGDILRVISAPGASLATELAAIVGATGASLGAITQIEPAVKIQVSRVTLGAPVAGNVVTINVEGATAAYTIKTTVLADELAAIAKALANANSMFEDNKYIQITAYPTYLEIRSRIDYQTINYTASIVQGLGASLGTIGTSMDAGIGKITFATALTAALPAGTRIGTVNQIPIGIIDKTIDLSLYDGMVPMEGSTCAYDQGEFYSQIVNFDAQVVDRLRRISWMPAIV